MMTLRSIVALLLLVVLSATSAPARAGDGPSVKVPLDIDVYDEPGGKGNPRNGFLKGGRIVNLAEKQGRWCEVYGNAVPGDRGWVWCGKGDDGKNYKLIFLNGEPAPAPAPTPVKSDCKEVGPNEEAAGGSSDPTMKYECEESGNGNRKCCWVKYP